MDREERERLWEKHEEGERWQKHRNGADGDDPGEDKNADSCSLKTLQRRAQINSENS